MSILEKILFVIIPIIFLYKGLACIFNTNKEYKNNLKIVEEFWSKFYDIPVLGYISRQNVNWVKAGGEFYIFAWGIFATLLSLILFYAIAMQGF